METNHQNEIDSLTHMIIGCAMKIQTALGNGFSQSDAFGKGVYLPTCISN